MLLILAIITCLTSDSLHPNLLAPYPIIKDMELIECQFEKGVSARDLIRFMCQGSGSWDISHRKILKSTIPDMPFVAIGGGGEGFTESQRL